MNPVTTLLYYPGCTIRRDFPNIEKAALAVLKALGYNVVELRDWYCCGGFPGILSWDHTRYVSALRTLSLAYKQAQEVNSTTIVTLCPFCYNTLKQASTLHEVNLEMYRRVAEYIKDDVEPYRGGLKVVHFVELLNEKVDTLAKLAEGRLKNVRVATYYGCTLLRPRSVAVDNPDNPQIVERIVKALGAEVVTHPYRSYCCGSFHVLLDPDIVKKNVERIASIVMSAKTDIVVTPCQLCLYNVRKYSSLNIIDVAELVAYALNIVDVLSFEVLKVMKSFMKQ